MYPDWVEKVRKECKVSIKESKGFYYAYKCTSKKIPGETKRQSIQTYVGRITPEGLIPAITVVFTPLKTEASTIGEIFNLENIPDEDRKLIEKIIIVKAKKEWFLSKLKKKEEEILVKYNQEENGKVLI